MAKASLKAPDEYRVVVCSFSELNAATQAACLGILRDGGAVDVESASDELPVAVKVVVAFEDNAPVGIGAIKRDRPGYANQVARDARVDARPDGLELGYVAVGVAHGNRGLSKRITAMLLSGVKEPLFATTDSPWMSSNLRNSGFSTAGSTWRGKRGTLSLWVRTSN